MPNINRQSRVAKRPEDRPIDSTGWCGLCLYNIPQGTLMILMPGFTMLLIGIVLLALPGHPPHTLYLGLLIAILGAVLTCGAAIYWIIFWLRYRPTKMKQPDDVQLVGIRIYQISKNYYPPENPVEVVDTAEPGPSSRPPQRNGRLAVPRDPRRL